MDDQRYAEIDAKLDRLQKQLVRRWLIAVAGLLIACGSIWYAVHQAQNQSHANQQTIAALAAARKQSSLQSCQDQNTRHINAIAYLEKLAKQESKGASKAKQAEINKSLAEYHLLFQALAPIQNCQHLVQVESRPHS